MTLHTDRRELLGAMGFAAVAGLFGDALSAPLARAAEAGGPAGFKPVNRVLSKSQRAVLSAYCERIVPKTDTPGAIEAGVPDFVEMMLGDWSTEAERAPFIAGLDAIDGHAKKSFKKGFARLKAKDQDKVILTLTTGGVSGAPADFFWQSRQMVLTGYYTSEIGMTVERIYIPVPGEYNGAYPYAQAGRIFNG
jgi:gluconate 2-dehydrogenase gamma chain